MMKCVDFILKHITFQKPTNVNTNQVYAVIAGSFPACLAGYVDEFGDIDVFLVINTLDALRMKIYHKLIKTLKVMANIIHPRGTNYWEYDRNSDIYSVTTIGLIQFIAREYSGCYNYLDTLFFIGFHHVTRWKLVMKQLHEGGQNLIIIRYIPQGNGMLADSTIIDITPEEYEKLQILSYPIKHFESQTIRGRSPPNLVQQCIINIERFGIITTVN